MHASSLLPTFLSDCLDARFVFQQHSISAHDARNSSTAAVQTIQESSSSWLNPGRAFMQHFRKGDSCRFLLVIYKVGYYIGVGYVT